MTEPADLTPPAPTWSPETRTWVSLLLFVHLFAVVVAVTTLHAAQRAAGATARPVRAVLAESAPDGPADQLSVRPFPSDARRTDTDVDFRSRSTSQRADGSTEACHCPSRPLQPLVRLRRYQALANATGTLASGEMGDAAASILPKAIAASVLRQRDGHRRRRFAFGRWAARTSTT